MLFSMGNYKAPRMDGFQVDFYKSQWEVVRDSFCSLIKQSFVDHSVIKSLNKTLITLILKPVVNLR